MLNKKQIPNFPNYTININGEIKNQNGLILKPRIDSYGYTFYCLYNKPMKKEYKTHRIMMDTFKPIINSNKLQVNHKDGNKLNNHLDNLEWCTHQENIDHSFKIGKRDNNRSNKLNKTKANIIRYGLLNKYFTISELAKLFNVSTTTIKNIKYNKTWSIN